MNTVKVGFAMCGSFCTFERAIKQIERLTGAGYEVLPVMSEIAAGTDTRFGRAEAIRKRVEDLCGREIITSVKDAEPIGPKKLTDIMVVAPCTGNTLAKLANAVTDTPVTMAVKSHLRQSKPVLLCIATNDALGASAQNIGRLLNRRHYYFVPFRQDDPVNKPCSLVADFDRLPEALILALEGKQLQPVLC